MKQVLSILIVLLICSVVFAQGAREVNTQLEGYGTQTRGGLDGRIIKVTNLNADGPGSFKEAIEAEGPRLVVFEVGGVIDLGY